jgi:putative ABC transport system permease protein
MTLRYAWRSLAKSPGFVAIAVVALGVGLGLSTTMFAVMDSVLHPFVPYRDPATLFHVNWWFGRRNPMSPAELYRYIRDNTTSFAAVLPERYAGQVLVTPGGDEEVGVQWVVRQHFGVTGETVARGRTFTPSDGDDVAIVAHELWRKLYGRRRDLAGAKITLDNRVYAVIGVLPEGGRSAVRLLMDESVTQGSVRAYVRPIVRLKPGVTKEQAAEELRRLARLLTARHGAQEAPFAFELLPSVWPREEMRDIQKAMIGAALLVLIIACVNLAHLMLARGLAKRREFALRMALGASRQAVVRQMFTECAIITLAGITLGLFVTLWGADFLKNRMPPEVSWIGLVRPQLSWRVFAMGAGAAAISAVLFGLLPAIRVALAVDVQDPLKDDSGTTTGRHRQRYSPLVVSEVALALVLLMAGGLMLRTIAKLSREHLNFETRTLYRAWVMEPRQRLGDSTRTPALSRADLIAAASSAPDVAAVALKTYSPLPGRAFTAEMVTGDSTRIIPSHTVDVVTPNYITVLGLPVIRGRNFEPGDAAGSGVAIIDPVAAQKLYPNQDALGKMIKLGAPASDGAWVPIVGIMRSPSVLEARESYAPSPVIMVARADTRGFGQLIFRTRSDNPRVAATIQARIRTMTGRSTFVAPFDYARRAELVSRGFLAKVFVAMGAVALGLAALGLYGVLAYAVNRRMREFAVRVALGASAANLRRMVLHDGAVMLLAGTGLGAFAALAASRYLDAVLVSVLPSDVIALVMSEAVLLGVGFAAALAPARRAARANPLDILRAV